MSALISRTRWYWMIWFHRYSLLLDKKSKSHAGLIDCCFFFIVLLSLQHPMEMQMAWWLSTPSLSSFACRKEVCMLQSASKTDLFHSLKYSDRWHFLGGSTFSFSLKLALAVAWQRGESTTQMLVLPRWLLALPCLYLSDVFGLVWAVCALGKDCPGLHGTTCGWSSFQWKSGVSSVWCSFKNQNQRGLFGVDNL